MWAELDAHHDKVIVSCSVAGFRNLSETPQSISK